MTNDVTFRRIHGRIVPIKVTPAQKKAAIGAAQGGAVAAAGVGVSMASGNVYRKAVVSSASMGMKAFKKIETVIGGTKSAQGSLFQYAANGNADKAFKSLKFSANLGKAAGVLKSISKPLGAAMIAGGAVHAVNSLPKKSQKELSPAMVAGGGAALAYAAPKAMKLSTEAFAAGMGSKQMAMSFASGKIKSALPTIRLLGMKILKKGI